MIWMDHNSINTYDAWLEQNCFIIEGIFGNYSASQYSNSSPRAIFWARRN